MRPPAPLDEAERLRILHELDVLDTDPEVDYDDVVSLAAHICGVPMSLVSLVDADRQWFKARIGLDATETSRDVSFCAHAILGKDLMVVPDALADRRFADNPAVRQDPGVRFYAGAPLVTTDGHALGTLCVVDAVPRRLSLGQLQALRALARQVTAQLELRRYGSLLARNLARLHALERHLDDLGALAGLLRGPLIALRQGLDDRRIDWDAAIMPHAEPFGRLLDELLHLAGPAPAAALHLRDVDLATLTQRAVESVRPIADAKNVPVLNTRNGRTLVHADPVRLEQALGHLLYNAIKYAPTGGRVEVATTSESGPTVRVLDRDPVSGSRPSLFGHFYDGAIGRGLDVAGPDRGLGIVKAIFDAHHASVALCDRPGDGTSLHVVFPAP
jgi:signal transduction histidine kinase